MNELDVKTEAEREDLFGDLSDEALDRTEGPLLMSCGGNWTAK